MVSNLKFTVLALDGKINLLLSLEDERSLIMMLIKTNIKIKIDKVVTKITMLVYLTELVGSGKEFCLVAWR